MVHFISLITSNTTNIKIALKIQLSDFPIYSGLLLSSLQVCAIFVCGIVNVFEVVFNDHLTLGTLSALQTDSESRRSLISQAKMEGHSLLYSATLPTTPGVATRGFEPPIARGFIEPVS